MDTLAKRLAGAREAAGITQEQLAEKAGCSQSLIGNLESGRQLTSSKIPAIAQVLRVSALWLSEGRGQREHGIISGVMQVREATPIYGDTNDFIPINRATFKLSAGVSGYAIELDQGEAPPIFFRAGWYKRNGFEPDYLFAIRVSGESMAPGLHDGDVVVVNTAETTPKDGVVFAVNYEGEMVIKRVRLEGGICWLDSDSSDQLRYRPRQCGENCFIIGRVVHKQSELI